MILLGLNLSYDADTGLIHLRVAPSHGRHERHKVARQERFAEDEREAKNVDRVREAIDIGAEEHCTTCLREFESGEQAVVSDTLRRQASAIRHRAKRETEEATKLAASADDTAESLRGFTSL